MRGDSRPASAHKMFLVCGEILYDVFVRSGPDEPLRLDARPGGSPFNVAIGLARLGQPAQFAGAVSTDLLGTRLAETLTREKVGTDHLVRKRLPCTLSLVDIKDSRDAEYAFYAENTADRNFRIVDLREISPLVRFIHIGSYSTVIEPIASTVATLVESEAPRRLISYDLNVRLNVEPDRAIWKAKIDQLSRRAHLIKGSLDDFESLYPSVPISEIVSSFLANGVSLVVVTKGDQGAAAWSTRATAECPVKKVKVSDTVGAGDSFQAGLLARLAQRELTSPERLASMDNSDLHDLLSWAIHAAAFTCQHSGAQMPYRDELSQT